MWYNVNNEKYLSRHLACSKTSLFWVLVVIQNVSLLKYNILHCSKTISVEYKALISVKWNGANNTTIFSLKILLEMWLIRFAVSGKTSVERLKKLKSRNTGRNPDWCGLVDWALACKPRSCRFDSQSGNMPHLWMGVCERQLIDVSLPISLPSSV